MDNGPCVKVGNLILLKAKYSYLPQMSKNPLLLVEEYSMYYVDGFRCLDGDKFWSASKVDLDLFFDVIS